MNNSVSVITPVYNGERFIEPCICNVIEQNCPDSEHIIVDGGSQDRTMDIVTSYASRYPHIRWISEKDRGQSDAMNKGLGMAKGSFIGILNVDDYYAPGALSRAVKLFHDLPDFSFLVGNCNVWDDTGSLLYISKPEKISLTNILRGKFMEAFPMNPSAYFYHKALHERIGFYRIDEHYAMDMDFILRAIQSAHVVYCNEIWGNYRYFAGTKTHREDMSGNNRKRVLALISEYTRQLPISRRYAIYILRLVDMLSNTGQSFIGQTSGRTHS